MESYPLKNIFTDTENSDSDIEPTLTRRVRMRRIEDESSDSSKGDIQDDDIIDLEIDSEESHNSAHLTSTALKISSDTPYSNDKEEFHDSREDIETERSYNVIEKSISNACTSDEEDTDSTEYPASVQELSLPEDNFASSDEDTRSSIRRSRRVKHVRTVKELTIDALNRGLEAPIEARFCKEKGKGRGVFSLSDIPRGTYICEYKTTSVYSKKEHLKREMEYSINEEIVATVEAKVDGRVMFFDGTRRLNQFGSLLNHSPQPNCKPFPPVFVRGKYRIGFLALQDISKDTELTWDYNYRDPKWPWLYGAKVEEPADPKPTSTIAPTAIGPSTTALKKKVTSFERYRRSYFCPVPNCKSRAQKKLSNHLKSVHGIVNSEERHRLLKESKIRGPAKHKERKLTITLKECFAREKARSCGLVIPNIEKKRGSTRHYPRFSIESEAILTKFFDNLTSFDGGCRSLREARQICADVSKCLAFVNPNACIWTSLTNVARVKLFFEQLTADGIGSDGLTTKVERLQTALKYCIRENSSGVSFDECTGTISRLSMWKSTFLKSKRSSQIEREMCANREAESKYLSCIDGFFQSWQVQNFLKEVHQCQHLSDENVTYLATYLFASLTYKNWQRPSPALHLTLSEANEAVLIEGKLTIHSRTHKTAHTYGPAILVLEGQDIDLFKMYMNSVRPNIPTSSTNTVALLTSNGRPLTHYRDLLLSLTRKLGLTMLPNFSTIRKAGATATVSSQGAKGLEIISEHMSHSRSTSERYYRMRKRDKGAVEAFQTIKNITSETTGNPTQTISPPNAEHSTPPPNQTSKDMISETTDNPTPTTPLPNPTLPMPLPNPQDTINTSLEDYFCSHIAKGKTPSLKECRAFLIETKDKQKSGKQIQDKIRNIIKKL